jgi:tetratricopeptide (TPR) repeat protein
LRSRVATEPENVAPRLELADAYRERGYPDIALEICQLAVARFPESAEAQLVLARGLRDLNLQNKAISGLGGFLQSHPQTDAKYYSWLALLHDESGAWPAGEPAHRQALELAPKVDYLHNNLGYNLLMQRKFEAAVDPLKEALKLNPGSRLARNNLGLALAHAGSGEQALSVWRKAADDATAHNNLAAVLIEKGNYSGARRELELALGYNKSFPAALKNLELVSRLDGSPAVFHVKQGKAGTRWSRWWAGVKKFLVGPVNNPRKEAARAVSAPAAGEER